MVTGLRAAIKFVEQFLRRNLFLKRGKSLPCDSKNAKLCFTCHYIRDQLTGSHTVSLDKPAVVFTKHGNYVIGDSAPHIQTHGRHVIVSYGFKSPFLDKLLKEVFNHVRKEGKTEKMSILQLKTDDGAS